VYLCHWKFNFGNSISFYFKLCGLIRRRELFIVVPPETAIFTWKMFWGYAPLKITMLKKMWLNKIRDRE